MKPFSPPTIYHDGKDLFLEWPAGPVSPARAMRFPFTEGGLGRALAHVPNIAKAAGYVTGRSNFAKIAKDNHTASDRLANTKVKVAKATKASREKAGFTDAMREAASAAVRKLKVGE